MKLLPGLLVTLTLTAGLAGGVRAYSVAATAGPPAVPAPVAVATPPRPQVVRPGVVVRWAPCRAPAVRVGKACVTHVVHTVTIAPPATTPTVSAPVSTRAPHAAPTRPARHPAQESEPGDDHHGESDDGDDGGGGDD
jgi:hypothetical protein